MKVSLILLFSFLFLANSAILNITDIFSLQSEVKNDSVVFNARLNGAPSSQGWLCWGLGSKMYPADLICCYKNSTNARLECGDYFNNFESVTGDYFPAPVKDELFKGGKNDVVLLETEEKQNYRRFQVSRKLNTSDNYDFAYTPNLNHLIWAYSNKSDNITKIEGHTSYGKGYFNLGESSGMRRMIFGLGFLVSCLMMIVF